MTTTAVVVITGSKLPEDRVRSEALNVAEYPVKPVEVEKFVALVQQLKDDWDSEVILPEADMADRGA
jgi:CheY-like chemotaxis protein